MVTWYHFVSVLPFTANDHGLLHVTGSKTELTPTKTSTSLSSRSMSEAVRCPVHLEVMDFRLTSRSQR